MMADELAAPQQTLASRAPAGTAFYGALLQHGFNPVQAAALAGNMQQESEFNPSAPNEKEGAFGLLQWRLERLQNLNAFAARRGTPISDVNTQIDFIKWEMAGPEAANAKAFLSAQTVDEANAALKGYIRYGDNSEGTRLRNADVFAGVPPREAEYQARNATGGYQMHGGVASRGGYLMEDPGFSLSRIPQRQPGFLESVVDDAQKQQAAPPVSGAPTVAAAEQTPPPPIVVPQLPKPTVQPMRPLPAPTPMEHYLAMLKLKPQDQASG